MYLLSSLWSIDFEDNYFSFSEKNQDRLYKIPLYSKHVRSLNLANAVNFVDYEGLKQIY